MDCWETPKINIYKVVSEIIQQVYKNFKIYLARDTIKKT